MLCLRIRAGVTRQINKEGWPVPAVSVAVEGGRLVDLAEERVLCQEAAEFGIEVAGFRVVEARLGVEDVSGEGEAVGAVGQFFWESEVAPGILGNY
jgi:hypothetical protein